MMSLTSITLFLSTLSLVSAGGHNVLSVEPYLAEWCAAQFPDQITYTGFELAAHMKYRDYTRIEPYLGNYCFDQFPGDLASQKREATLITMRDSHVQIEPYFMEWGMIQMRTPASNSRINLERYIQEWCVKGQFRRVIHDHEAALGDVFGPNALTMEPTFGKWCFAQFPSELQDLDEASTTAALANDHVPLEDYLIKWEAADYGARKASRHILTDPHTEIGFGAGVAIAVVVFSFFALICYCWKRRQNQKDTAFQQSVAAAEHGGEGAFNA